MKCTFEYVLCSSSREKYIVSCYHFSMKDMILEIKRKAIAINSDSSLVNIESRLIDLKQQIKILDRYLDLKMEKN